MRRVVALAVLLALASRARAAPWPWTLEAGVEADSNVERVETDPSSTVAPIAAVAARAGATIAHRDELAGGVLSLAASGSLRGIANDRSETSVEDIGLVAGDARWLHAIGDQPAGRGGVSLGVDALAADAFALDAPLGDRTFRNLGGDGVAIVRASDTARLSLTAGVRQFEYKPDRTFDYTAPAASARLDLELWSSPDHARTLELAALLGFEARAFPSGAYVDVCAPGVIRATCTGAAGFDRRDRFERAGATATYVGARVYSLAYELVQIASNSYGESLLRHRITASATSELLAGIYATGIATLQLDTYPDGLLIADDLQRTQFSNLDDENRSSLQVRLGRPVTARWTLEARAAIWRDIDDSSLPGEHFRRELLYLGAVYAHE